MKGKVEIESNLVKKITQYSSGHTLINTLAWIVVRSLKSICFFIINLKKSYIIERDLSGDLPFVKSKIDVLFREGELSDFKSLSRILKPWNHWGKLIEKRFQRGQTCLVCIHKEIVIGYMWMSSVSETDKNLGITIYPKDEESYGFDLYVLPEYRKYQVGFELISRWLFYAQSSGKKKAIGGIMDYNKPMLMMMLLVFGFKRTKVYHHIEFFKKRGVIISSNKIE